MAKVKIARKNISLDMTAMCDVAFLLLTFFMLATKFKPEEPMKVDTPSSVSDITLPDVDIMTISVGKDGQVFFGVDAQPVREGMLTQIATKYGLSLSAKEIKDFSLLASFGLPVGNLKSFLALSTDQRNNIVQPGIPIDSANNELRDWIAFARYANVKLRITIKGDSDADYKTISKVINTLQDQNINKFNLITKLEARPNIN